MKIYYVNLSYPTTNLWFWIWILNLQEQLPWFLKWPKETNTSTKKTIMLDTKLLMKQLKLNIYPLLKTLLIFLPNPWPLWNLIPWEKILFSSVPLEITDQFEMTSNWERCVTNPVQLSSIQFDAILLLHSSDWLLLFLSLFSLSLLYFSPCIIFPFPIFSNVYFIPSWFDFILVSFHKNIVFVFLFIFVTITFQLFLSLEQMFTLFVSLNKSTFLIWSLVWLCFCFVYFSWDPVNLT